MKEELHHVLHTKLPWLMDTLYCVFFCTVCSTAYTSQPSMSIFIFICQGKGSHFEVYLQVHYSTRKWATAHESTRHTHVAATVAQHAPHRTPCGSSGDRTTPTTIFALARFVAGGRHSRGQMRHPLPPPLAAVAGGVGGVGVDDCARGVHVCPPSWSHPRSPRS